MPAGVRVACCQIAPDVERPDQNAELALEAIAGAVDAGAQIVVLPELVNSGYVFTSVDEARAAAVPRRRRAARGLGAGGGAR